MKHSLKFIGNLIFILFLFSVLFSFAMFQGGFVSWFLFYSFLPIFLYQILLLLYPINKWKINRELSRNVLQAGGDITVKITLERKIPFPLFYCVIEEVLPDSLQRIDSKQHKYYLLEKGKDWSVNRQAKKMLFPAIRRKMTITYSLAQIPRGEHQLSQVRIRTGDVFGFVKKETMLETENRITCYPNVLPLNMYQMKESAAEGSKIVARSHAHSNIASGVREYTPGDRFSTIDWKQTARKNTIMTKEFEQEEGSNLFVILDSCTREKEHPLLYEATVEIALTITELWKKNGKELGFLSIGGKNETTLFPITREIDGKSRIRNYLSNAQPTGNVPFSQRLKEEFQQTGQGSTILFITTKIDKPLTEISRKLKVGKKQVYVLLVRSRRQKDEMIRAYIHDLKQLGVGVCILTEQELTSSPIEVTFNETSF